jgi:hypothetical protein
LFIPASAKTASKAKSNHTSRFCFLRLNSKLKTWQSAVNFLASNLHPLAFCPLPSHHDSAPLEWQRRLRQGLIVPGWVSDAPSFVHQNAKQNGDGGGSE